MEPRPAMAMTGFAEVIMGRRVAVSYICDVRDLCSDFVVAVPLGVPEDVEMIATCGDQAEVSDFKLRSEEGISPLRYGTHVFKFKTTDTLDQVSEFNCRLSGSWGVPIRIGAITVTCKVLDSDQ
jgi:hypothetical protein